MVRRTYLDILDILPYRELQVVSFQCVHNANVRYKMKLVALGLFLQQEMRQNRGPLIISPLEFVLKFAQIVLLD